MVAWLITQRFGQDFRLDSLRNVLAFFAAAGVGPAISAIVATAGFVLFYNSGAPVVTTWLNWFASDALGIIMVAPLLIGLGGLRRDLPDRWELTEGTLTLAALAAVSAIAFGSPAHYWWYTVLPLGLLLPALLAAHCRPVFAAAAALILGCAVVWTTTFGIGELRRDLELARSRVCCASDVAGHLDLYAGARRSVCREAAQRESARGQQQSAQGQQ